MMVPTKPLLDALGEAIRVTPDGRPPVDATAIVARSPVLDADGQYQWGDLILDMPAAPAYAVGDAIRVRGR